MMKSKRPLNEVIKQRRTQMLIHSYLYYHEDTTLVSDDTWQRWANELRDLQEANPKESKIDFFDKEFDGWTGDTGIHLPFNRWVISKARYIASITSLHE